MNYMQKMGIDPNTVEGLVRIQMLNCSDIPDEAGRKEKSFSRCSFEDLDCTECVARRLLAEVPTKKVKRWETYDGDFAKARTIFIEMCSKVNCGECGIYKMSRTTLECFVNWLMEEVEVEA